MTFEFPWRSSKQNCFAFAYKFTIILYHQALQRLFSHPRHLIEGRNTSARKKTSCLSKHVRTFFLQHHNCLNNWLLSLKSVNTSCRGAKMLKFTCLVKQAQSKGSDFLQKRKLPVHLWSHIKDKSFANLKMKL